MMELAETVKEVFIYFPFLQCLVYCAVSIWVMNYDDYLIELLITKAFMRET